MKKICLALSVLAIAVTFSSCSKSNDGPSTTSSVMFVNGCNGSSNVTAKINNAVVNGANSIAYFNTSGYQSVTSGSSIGINFYLTNQGVPLCSGTPSLNAGSNYSVFAGGIVTAPIFVVATDDLTAPNTGYAKVRFINLSSDTLNESCYIGVGTSKLDSNISAGIYTPYFEVTATTGAQVLLQDPLKPTILAELSSQAFNAGKIYTVMLTGTAAGTGTSGLTLTVINNN